MNEVRQYRQTPGVVCRKIADEVMLVPVEGKLAHDQLLFFLDPVGEFVWNRLNTTSIEAMVDAITDGFDVDEQTARDDLDTFLDDLTAAGLAAPSPDADE